MIDSVKTRLRRTLLLSALLAASSALAQTQNQKNISITIEPQSLATALQAFSRQSGLQVGFESNLVKDLRTQGTRDAKTAAEALSALLDGTGLQYHFVNGRTAVIIGEKPARSADSASMLYDAQIHLAQANATDSTPESAPARRGEGLEEVVVTATKRTESLQKLPQAVTAITSQRLDELNALSFADYFRDVPGLMLETDVRGKLDFSIRGTTDFISGIPSTTATVAQYIDEIPVTATGAQIDMRLVDIDRIEVLRGPQGTYYGEGGLGGVIRIITKKPDLNHFAASAEGRLANTSHGGMSDQESATVNLPVFENKFALRASYFNALDSGYIDVGNTAHRGDLQTTGILIRDANSNRSEGGRAMAYYEPNERLSILAEAMTTQSHQGLIGSYDPDVENLVEAVVCPSPPGPTLCGEVKQFQTANLYNLTVNVELGWASLVSASSLGQTEYQLHPFNPQTGEADTQNPPTVNDGRTVTQELRLSSPQNGSEHWDYTAGAFYTHQKVVDVGSAVAGSTAIPNTDISREAALFAEAGYRFSSRWQARLGLRDSNFYQDQIKSKPLPPGPGGQVGFETTESDRKYTPVTGRAVLSYTPNDSRLLYGSVSSGFRKGGFNMPSPFPQVTIPEAYDSDKATNYELGWKLSFPSRQATLNGAVYHIDWKNVQTVGLTSGTPALSYYRNGGDVYVDGLELESGLEIYKGLSLHASLSYIYARLAEDYIFTNDPTVTQNKKGEKGDKMPFVAPLSGSLSLNYHRPLGVSGLRGFAIFNAQYQGRRASDYNAKFQDPRQPSYAIMDPYWLAGAQFGVESRRWRAALYVDNVFDTQAQVMRVPSNTTGHYIQITTKPRTVGMFLRYSFD